MPDPDLEICGEGGGGHPNSEIRGGPPVSPPPNFFRPIGPQFGLKIKWGGGGGGAARAPPQDPSLSWSLMGDGGTWRFDCTVFFLTLICILCLFAWF